MAAVLPDRETLLAAGFIPMTSSPLKDAIRSQLRIKHQIQHNRKYRWFNLPKNMDAELLESMLFYRYSIMFFYVSELDEFFILPYTLNGNDVKKSLDCYGRYTQVTPCPYHGNAAVDKDKNPDVWIPGLYRKPIYDVMLPEELEEDSWDKYCVILNDYTKQISQHAIPRAVLDDPLLDAEADLIPYLHTTLQNETGVTAVRVNNQDEYQNVNALNVMVNNGAVQGRRYIAVEGAVDFQEFGEMPSGKTGEYMQALESIDNYRLSLLGIDQAGVFQKSQYINDQTQALGGGATELIANDGLALRQEFCDRVNSLFGINIWCEPSENLMGDMNGDGMVFDNQDQSGEGVGDQPAGGEENGI